MTDSGWFTHLVVTASTHFESQGFTGLFIVEVASLAEMAVLAACATGKQRVNACLRKTNILQLECLSCTADSAAESNHEQSKSCGLVTYTHNTQNTTQTTVIYYAHGESKAGMLACLRLRHYFEHSCNACSGLLNCPPCILQWLLGSFYTSIVLCLASLQLTLQVFDEVVRRSLLRSSFCCDLM